MICLHLANGFEEIEAITVADVLRRGGLALSLVSVEETKVVTGAHGISVTADLLFTETDYNACSMLILPGGMPGTKKLMAHPGLGDQLKIFAREGKPIAAICAAPMVLGRLGLVRGKEATIYPDMTKELSGATFVDRPVVKDGNITTSQGPGTAMEFAFALLEALAGAEVANQVKGDMLIQ